MLKRSQKALNSLNHNYTCMIYEQMFVINKEAKHITISIL
jgi:hypothetical protein